MGTDLGCTLEMWFTGQSVFWGQNCKWGKWSVITPWQHGVNWVRLDDNPTLACLSQVCKGAGAKMFIQHCLWEWVAGGCPSMHPSGTGGGETWWNVTQHTELMLKYRLMQEVQCHPKVRRNRRKSIAQKYVCNFTKNLPKEVHDGC